MVDLICRQFVSIIAFCLMCSTTRIAITFSINLDKYGKLDRGQFLSQNIAVKCMDFKIPLTTADLNETGNDTVEKVNLIIRTINHINK